MKMCVAIFISLFAGMSIFTFIHVFRKEKGSIMKFLRDIKEERKRIENIDRINELIRAIPEKEIESL